LEPTDLPLRKVLERPNKPIRAAYFPDTHAVDKGCHVPQGAERPTSCY